MSFASDIGRMVARGPQRPLTDQETMTLLTLTMSCEEPVEKQIAMYRDIVSKSQALAILDQRFRLHFGEQVPFSPPLLIWLSTLADRPGTIVLLLAVLAHLKAEGREFSLNGLIGSYFMEGIPTQVNYQLAWDGQKANEDRLKSLNITQRAFGGNMLDYDEAWK